MREIHLKKKRGTTPLRGGRKTNLSGGDERAQTYATKSQASKTKGKRE